jgi:hypothetical protein
MHSRVAISDNKLITNFEAREVRDEREAVIIG